MKNKITIKHLVLLSLFTFCLSTGFAQNDKGQLETKKYLESTIDYSNEILIGSTSQKVLASDIIESKLTFSTGDKHSYGTIKQQYFIKSGSKLTPFSYQNEMMASSEFIESIKSKKFKLNTEKDGIAFQSMLKLFDNERGLGFFKEGNMWYFIRSKFFSKIRAYVVTTDKKGQISKVVYVDELEKDLPETLLKAGEVEQDNNIEKNTISKKDSAYMHRFLLENANYTFEIAPLNFYSVNKISSISINKCNMIITHGEKGMSSSLIKSFMLVSNNDEYIKKASINDLLEMPLFLESLQKKYKIDTEEDARLFQYVLDDLSPVSRSDIELKKFYKKDNMWIFVREKRFDDLKGFILVLDDKNKVSYMEYATISEESMLRIKMKNPSFKVDYKFTLVKPATNKITVKQGQGLSVEISFDADMVNAKGCWIMKRFDGRDNGMYAATTLKSPYTTGITGGALENRSHTVEYFLLKSGAEDTDDALGVIKIEITVE